MLLFVVSVLCIAPVHWILRQFTAKLGAGPAGEVAGSLVGLAVVGAASVMIAMSTVGQPWGVFVPGAILGLVVVVADIRRARDR